MQGEVGKGLTAALARAQADLARLGLDSLQGAAAALETQREQATAALRSLLAKLETFGGVAEAAASFQSKLDALEGQARKATEDAARLEGEQSRIEREAKAEMGRHEATLQAVGARLDDLAKRPAPAEVPKPAGPTG